MLGMAVSITYFGINLGYFCNPIIYGLIYDNVSKTQKTLAYPASILYLTIILLPCFWFTFRFSYLYFK